MRTLITGVFSCFSLFFLCLFSPSHAYQEFQDCAQQTRYFLLYSDLIIMGVVEDVVLDRVTDAELGASSEGADKCFRNAYVFRYKILELMKGSYPFDEIVVIELMQDGMPASAVVGDTVMVCVDYRKFLKGGSYLLRSPFAHYSLSSETWKSKANECRDSVFTLSSIKSVIEEAKIENIIKNADLIVVGQIDSLKHSIYKSPDGYKSVHMLDVTMSVDAILKGEYDASLLKFVMIPSVGNWPEWNRFVYVPKNISNGDRWYAFLKMGEAGYYPFAGSNGMLKMDSNKLIYNNRVSYKYDKHELEDIIRR